MRIVLLWPRNNNSVIYCLHSEGMGKVLFSQVSVCSHLQGGPTLDQGGSLPWMGRGYLLWMAGGLPTLDGHPKESSEITKILLFF